jgi:hypothetical protein
MTATQTAAETHTRAACTDGECPVHPMCETCDETLKTICPECGENGNDGDCTTCDQSGEVPCA